MYFTGHDGETNLVKILSWAGKASGNLKSVDGLAHSTPPAGTLMGERVMMVDNLSFGTSKQEELQNGRISLYTLWFLILVRRVAPPGGSAL